MTQSKSRLIELKIVAMWLALAALGVVVFFQIHTTLIFFGLFLVQNPATRIPGWNTYTIHGLGRFLYLMLGIMWLFGVSLLGSYLRDGEQYGNLNGRFLRLALALIVTYSIAYLLLWLLS